MAQSRKDNGKAHVGFRAAVHSAGALGRPGGAAALRANKDVGKSPNIVTRCHVGFWHYPDLTPASSALGGKADVRPIDCDVPGLTRTGHLARLLRPSNNPK